MLDYFFNFLIKTSFFLLFFQCLDVQVMDTKKCLLGTNRPLHAQRVDKNLKPQVSLTKELPTKLKLKITKNKMSIKKINAQLLCIETQSLTTAPKTC